MGSARCPPSGTCTPAADAGFLLLLALLYAQACSHRPNGVMAQRTALFCTAIHRFRATAIFYPNFYPNRRRSGVERLSLLVTAANPSGHRECATSLPSWSCGFDSRRPLQLINNFRSAVRVMTGSCRLSVGETVYSDIFPAELDSFELSHVDVSDWWDSPMFYPKCQEPESWPYKLESPPGSTVLSRPSH